MNYCSQCGAKVPSIAKFCSACGAPTTKLIEKDADAPLISQKEMITQSATSTDSQASRTICLHKNKVVKSNGVTFCEDCGESNEQHSNPHRKEFKEPSLFTRPLTLISLFIVIVILIALIGTVHTPASVLDNSIQPNADYKLGFNQGGTFDFSNQVLYAGGQVRQSCQLIVDMSQLGTTNDGIDWANVDATHFVQGCIDGYKQAH